MHIDKVDSDYSMASNDNLNRPGWFRNIFNRNIAPANSTSIQAIRTNSEFKTAIRTNSEFKTPEQMPVKKMPRTITISSDNLSNYKSPFTDSKDMDNRSDCYSVYANVAPVACLIDKRVESIFTNGWRVVGPDKELNKQVTGELNKMYFSINAKKAVRDAYITGMGLHELVADDAGNNYMLTRPTFNVMVENDDYGNPAIVHQYQGYGKETIDLDANSAVIITPIPTSFGTGVSLILRARPQIESYLMISDSNQAAIHRHGYPIFQLKMADADGQQIPIDQVAAMDGVTVDIQARSELYTNKESEIVSLNSNGVAQAPAYQELAVQELCRAFGMPNLFLGITSGVTEASAQPVLAVFYDSISSEQMEIAHAYQSQLIDRVILYKFNARPGDARFEFINPSPFNQLQKAQYLMQVSQITPGRPFSLIDANEMLKELSIDKELTPEDIKNLLPQQTIGQEDVPEVIKPEPKASNTTKGFKVN